MNQEDIFLQKKALRKEIKEYKKMHSAENILLDSNRIFRQVESLLQFKIAKVVLAYWSLPDEVYTHDFVIKWATEKKMVLPIIVGDELELREFSGTNGLVTTNSLGIKEPKAGEIVYPTDIDFAIIPGVAFDIKGNRLGRGKGYYDRFLTKSKAYKVAVGFNFQIKEMIPVTSFDVSVDLLVTTKNERYE